MRYPKTRAVANAGVIYVQRIVSEHGSIFHPVHQENDLGIDGLIELVHSEESTARLVAVQVKSGDSHFPNAQGDFVVHVDQPHLDYWLRFPVPVLVIGHSPSRDTALWVSVADYVQMERNFYREPVKRIRIPAHCRFDAAALSAGVTSVAIGSDARLVLKSISMCLGDDARKRFEGLRMLAVLPESRYHTITCLLAHRLIMDEDMKTAEAAVSLLGFFAALNLRSWATVGPEQLQQCQLAFRLCESLTEDEISRILKSYDDASFEGLLCRGDELVAMLASSRDRGRRILDATARDSANPINRRANALYLLYHCDSEQIKEVSEALQGDNELRDVVNCILSRNA